jgi:hypothetical protein
MCGLHQHGSGWGKTKSGALNIGLYSKYFGTSNSFLERQGRGISISQNGFIKVGYWKKGENIYVRGPAGRMNYSHTDFTSIN